MLIDTHAHLASSKFEGEVTELVAHAREKGVNRIITIACDLEDSPANVRIAEEHEGVFATVGIHPCYVDSIPDGESSQWIDELREMADHEKVVAIGEIGLDFFHPPPRDFSVLTWRTKQEEVFRAQLDLAIDLALPVVIHQRESNSEIMKVLESYKDSSLRAVLHCYTGTEAQAMAAFEMGHFVSFTGIVTYPKAEDVQRVASLLREDRIMVETDCPYLSPVPYRGKRCQPAFVRETASHLAKLRDVSFEEIARQSTQNAERFFQLSE